MLSFPLHPRDAAKLIVEQVMARRALGGKGSGNFGHTGRPGERGGSSPAEHLEAGGKHVLFESGGAQALVTREGKKFKLSFQRPSGFRSHGLTTYTSAQEALQVAREFIQQAGRGAPVQIRHAGGKGSGNWSHEGRPGERGGSGEGGVKVRNERSKLALKHFVPVTAVGQRRAEENEKIIARMVGGRVLEGASDSRGVMQRNAPVDVVTNFGGRKQGIEVKTLLNQKNDKLTVRKDAGEKKTFWGNSNHASVHIVAVDNRPGKGGQIYYRRGHGSFRLAGMTKVESAAHLRELLSEKTR